MIIWNDDRTKMIVLPLFRLAIRLNSRKTNETDFLINSDTLICIWILECPIGIIEDSSSRKWCFWLYFSSLHDYRIPSTWHSLVRTSWGEMERCKKTCFSAPQNAKKNQLKLKNQVRNRLLIDISSSSLKDYTCPYVVST